MVVVVVVVAAEKRMMKILTNYRGYNRDSWQGDQWRCWVWQQKDQELEFFFEGEGRRRPTELFSFFFFPLILEAVFCDTIWCMHTTSTSTTSISFAFLARSELKCNWSLSSGSWSKSVPGRLEELGEAKEYELLFCHIILEESNQCTSCNICRTLGPSAACGGPHSIREKTSCAEVSHLQLKVTM
jgi:hypothetical protein